MNKPVLIGLTGGVAAGKSLVAAEFVRLGAYLIDADVVAREVVAKGSLIFREIVAEFGPGFLLADGSIDRKALADLIFSDANRRAALNRITHPAIRGRINELIDEYCRVADRPFIVIDAALLVEGGLYKALDRVIVVDAPEETLIERMKLRDGLTEEQARARLAAQMPLDEKRSYADYVIDNAGSREATLEAAARVWAELKAQSF
ncbi:MAG: dephospho-CoA kinase [Deltaproteobacteria bacterium]|nr:dephospho-CoA kinase [Deltaproteobacteria bacterium]